MKDNRFNSRAIHVKSQCEEERAINVLEIKVKENTVVKGSILFISL